MGHWLVFERIDWDCLENLPEEVSGKMQAGVIQDYSNIIMYCSSASSAKYIGSGPKYSRCRIIVDFEYGFMIAIVASNDFSALSQDYKTIS
jgi:hypothetical protein